jgi:choline monooxygenase
MHMPRSLRHIVDDYRPDTPLAYASTIPSDWYTDPRVLDLERRTAFRQSWQAVGRSEQVVDPGAFVSAVLPGGEPILVARGPDQALRGFFNVCRHHAAEVVTAAHGTAQQFRCPYHGWTYGLDGSLKGTPDFTGVCEFDRASNGLVPIGCGEGARWVFVRVAAADVPAAAGLSLDSFLGGDLLGGLEGLGLDGLRWMERRHYHVDCNWKVFVDNFLDGGYHVPHLHKGLDSVLDYPEYTIEVGDRYCLQASPMAISEGDGPSVRRGDRASYYWIYPNFMINRYGGAMDTNLVIPRGVDRTEVIFDYYFTDVSPAARADNLASIALSEQIQDEDVGVCASVQRGLQSGAYHAGRLSVRREAGEQLFHRLLHADLTAGLEADALASTT